MLSDVFPVSYYVNLDARTDRRDAVEKEFGKLNYKSIRHSARADVTTTISHLEILRKAVDLNENVLIFEDDVEFLDDKLSLLNDILDDLSHTEWDMFYLGGNLLRPAFQTSKHLARLSHCYSAHAYGVNKAFAPALAKIVSNNTAQIIDVIYGDYIVPRTKCYISIPMVAIQRSDYSNVEKKIMTYDVPMQRYEKFIVKNKDV